MHAPRTEESVPFRFLVFGMVVYILGVSVSRATVYLRLGLGLGTKQTFNK